MARLRVFEDGPPPQGDDRRPWVWHPEVTRRDPQFGEFSIRGRWQRSPADPQDPVALIND